MNMATWESKKIPGNKQIRGINLTANSAGLQMPIHFDHLENENLVIAGYPSFSKSMLTGSSSESIHRFPKSYGNLAGKEIIQHKKVLDSAQVKYKNKIENCKVAKYKNQPDNEDSGVYELKPFIATNSDF